MADETYTGSFRIRLRQISIVPTGSLQELARIDMKIFSVLKIVAQRTIVKTSRGTQKQTARNKRTGAITKTKKIQITGGIYDD